MSYNVSQPKLIAAKAKTVNGVYIPVFEGTARWMPWWIFAEITLDKEGETVTTYTAIAPVVMNPPGD